MAPNAFDGEFGIQFTPDTATHYTTPELGELGRTAYDSGFDQVWVNDNLGYRNPFVTLTAIASNAPINLGSAILVPYLRNPVDVASTIASLSEMTGGKPVTVGIGRGSTHLAGDRVQLTKPYRMIRETTQMLERLLAGEDVHFGDYDLITSYFNLKPDTTMQMSFTPPGPVSFLVGGYGETAMTVGGKFMDGTVIGGSAFQLLKTNRLGGILDDADVAAAEADPDKDLKHVVEINVSISEDPLEAREFTKPYVGRTFSTSRSRLSDEAFEQLGVDPSKVERIRNAWAEGATLDEATDMVTDAMIESKFIVGTPEECIEQFEQIQEKLVDLPIDQISFAKLGPDYESSMKLLSREVIPAIS